MTIEEVRKQLRENEEAFKALPLPERARKLQEQGVEDLIRCGYITEEEAAAYREKPTELPTDRKGLVIAYFLSGADRDRERVPNFEETETIHDVIASFNLSDRGVFKDGGTIADVLTPEEQDEFTDGLHNAHTRARVKLAETFVDAKRKRIKAQLLKIFPPFIALELAEKKPKKGELDPIAHLREGLSGCGYRDKAKSLNAKDKKAIQEAAEYYLDLLELCFLNWDAELREAEYLDYLSEDGSVWVKDFEYRDDVDEALITYTGFYNLFEAAVMHSYTDGTARGAIDLLKWSIGKLDERGYFDSLKKTKFNVLLEEAKQC